MSKELKKISKLLSYVLRHRPDTIGIELDDNGWTNVDGLLEAAKDRGLTKEILDEVVATNDKKRFIFNDDGTKIRANQGHSVKVDLELEPSKPPNLLFHGTVDKFLDSIRKGGLIKGSRHHVHLSADRETATDVGGRRGKPVILIVATRLMINDGFEFYQSENGVWLVDAVPLQYLVFPQKETSK